jgi:hypothetical protein
MMNFKSQFMKKYVIILIAILASSDLAYSQEYQVYNWEDKREMMTLDDEQTELASIYLKYHQQYEYVYEGDGDDRDLYVYQTEHQIIKVNNDNAVAKNNRIYISMRDAIALVDIQARTITSDGRIIELDKNEIKEIEDEESGAGFKIFAIEGVEVGSEIEYYYTKKTTANYFGREFFQFTEPVINATFLLITPDNLKFSFKSYNGFAPVISDNVEGKYVYTARMDNIPSLKKEEFSTYNGSRQRLEFKLSYNKNTDRELFKWRDAAQLIYSQIFVVNKDEIKLLQKLLDLAEIKKYNTSEMKIGAVENYIKTNFYFDENASGQASDISFILENRIGSKMGMTKLLLNAIKLLGVKTEVVLTSGRNEIAFDADFETYNYLEDYLIFLPENDAFIAPYHAEFRYGMVPSDLTAIDGLFISETIVDKLPIPIHYIEHIPALPAKDNLDKMDVFVSFNEGLTANTVKLKRSFNGYSAAFIKAVYPLIEEERKQELLKSLVKFLAADADISNLGLEKSEFEFQTWTSPLVIDSEFESPSFIEMAGNIILFKAGELIGPQSELYQDTERKTRVQNEFNRLYDRSITINIPEGYQIENLDDLIFDKKVIEKEKEIFYFKSSYTIENGVLKIQVIEGYDEIYYPKEKFEAFREVINAAADWNKIVLVMSEK